MMAKMPVANKQYWLVPHGRTQADPSQAQDDTEDQKSLPIIMESTAGEDLLQNH